MFLCFAKSCNSCFLCESSSVHAPTVPPIKDDELISIYKCYVRPVVKCADVAWSSSITAAQKKTLEHLQKRACRTILGQRCTCTSYADAMQMLFRSAGSSLLMIWGESHCLRFAEGLANSERTNNLLPPTSLIPTTCVMCIITPTCVPGQLGSWTAQYLILSTCWTSRVSMLNKLNNFNNVIHIYV